MAQHCTSLEPPATMTHDVFLILSAGIAVVALVILIAIVKLNPFITLVVVSLTLGVALGMPIGTIVKAFETGVGSTLGHISLVVALGTMLGKMMAESGGASRIARTLIDLFGEKRVHWAMMTVSLIVGLPVFWEVGFVLLIPIVFTVAKRTRTSIIKAGLPMAAGLSVVHALVPPHPAATMAVSEYHADVGMTVLYALLIGIPTAAIAGPIFAAAIDKYIIINRENPMETQFVAEPKELPGFGITVFTVMLPVAMMLLGSWGGAIFGKDAYMTQVFAFFGSPVVALLIAALVSFVTLGTMRGFTRETILRFTHECLAPTATILLVIGAGGGFNRILTDAGISQAMVNIGRNANLSPLLLAWSIAALIRVATGSATVAMSTSAGIVAPLALSIPGMRPELLVLATGSGALILSHVNDAGFWMVKEFFDITVVQTFKSWTVAETIISIVGLVFTLLLAAVLH
jgi:gluconate:H+ symporter, GntP family